MPNRETSREYTVTVGPGVNDVLQECLRRINATMQGDAEADSYRHLGARREDTAIQMLRS